MFQNSWTVMTTNPALFSKMLFWNLTQATFWEFSDSKFISYTMHQYFGFSGMFEFNGLKASKTPLPLGYTRLDIMVSVLMFMYKVLIAAIRCLRRYWVAMRNMSPSQLINILVNNIVPVVGTKPLLVPNKAVYYCVYIL